MTARAEIENLLNRYAYAYDTADVDTISDTFAQDAVLTLRIADGDLIGPFEGRAAIGKLNSDSLASQTDQRRHVTTNLVIQSETDTVATTVSYLVLVTIENGTLKVISSGVYEDEIVKADGQWRFAKRHIALDLPY